MYLSIHPSIALGVSIGTFRFFWANFSVSSCSQSSKAATPRPVRSSGFQGREACGARVIGGSNPNEGR